jgi:hypothetical protein
MMMTHRSEQEAAVGGQNAHERSFYRRAVGRQSLRAIRPVEMWCPWKA